MFLGYSSLEQFAWSLIGGKKTWGASLLLGVTLPAFLTTWVWEDSRALVAYFGAMLLDYGLGISKGLLYKDPKTGKVEGIRTGKLFKIFPVAAGHIAILTIAHNAGIDYLANGVYTVGLTAYLLSAFKNGALLGIFPKEFASLIDKHKDKIEDETEGS